MTSAEWCRRTGWPPEEWGQLYYSEAAEILALYGLVYEFRFQTPSNRIGTVNP